VVFVSRFELHGRLLTDGVIVMGVIGNRQILADTSEFEAPKSGPGANSSRQRQKIDPFAQGTIDA
jgi:hypothetical protein